MAYRERVMAAVPAGSGFEPLMTLYLTEDTTPADIEAAAASGLVVGCKLYPAGATTNSDSGVKDFNSITDTLAAMAQVPRAKAPVSAPRREGLNH
jgi:dihydroorotase